MTNRIWQRVCLAGVLAVGGCGCELRAQDGSLVRTPPMGWNSWNLFGCKVSDAVVRATADDMVSNGMKDAGYQYVNIDDCWQGKRDAQGNITSNEKFPDMKALADYVHSKGLKIGLYSSPGPTTCAGYAGSYKHEEQDVRTWAAWGFDYVKYDWCSASKVYQQSEMPAVYKRLGDVLKKASRPIVYSICQYGVDRPWEWAPAVGGNLWRTTGDIQPDYGSILSIGFSQQGGLERFAGPGHWNDPDMLEVGNGQLTPDENRLHMTLWCMLAAPLLAGNDLTNMNPDVLGVLTNQEAIAIDQDSLGQQGYRLWQEGPVEVWVRQLSDGSRAVALFNRGGQPNPATLTFRDAGLPEKARIRELWSHHDLGEFTGKFQAVVPRHGVLLLKVR